MFIILSYFYNYLTFKHSVINIYTIASNNCRLQKSGITVKALHAPLAFYNPDFTPKKIFQLYGFKQALEFMNLRELRALLAQNGKNGGGRTLMHDASAIKLPDFQNPLKILKEKLIKFTPITLLNDVL